MGFVNARQSILAAIKTKEDIDISKIIINYPKGKMILNMDAIFECLLIPKYRMQNIVNLLSMDTVENKINNLEIIDMNLCILETWLEQNPNIFNKTQRKYLENNHDLVRKALC